MALMRIGSKAEVFQREGEKWHCTSGLQSDVTIEVGDASFYLHKFPLLSRSGLLKKLLGESSCTDGSNCVLALNELPGGAKAFEIVSKFCYGGKIELTPANVVSVRCAAEYLQMTEEYGEGNLIAQTEAFLNQVFGNWTDTIKALETCEEVLPHAEEIHIASRCIHSLAAKACGDPLLFNYSVSGKNETGRTLSGSSWNGIHITTKPQLTNDDWWYEDVSFLSLPLYKCLIQAVEEGGMRPESIAGAIAFYAMKYIPQLHKQSSIKNLSSSSTVSIPSEGDQRILLEEIVELLPNQKGVVPTRFLLRLLHTAMTLQTSPSCRENLERRVGLQLDQAALEDLLIPNMGNSDEIYDIDCFQRILDHFALMDQSSAAVSPCILEETQVLDGARPLSSLTTVADLVDAYLAEVAADANLKFPKFLTLAAAIPSYARLISDGIYRAIDIYLKAHPLLTDPEKEQICRFMNCQKLSLEASTHAAQNERLPLRVIVQVLFFEQLRLRTSVSGWFFASNNLDSSDNPSSVFTHSKNSSSPHRNRRTGVEDVQERVSELEKEYQSMKEEFRKLVKTRRFWNIFFRRKSRFSDSKSVKHSDSKKQQPGAKEQQPQKNVPRA